jgi:hypothetical protein
MAVNPGQCASCGAAGDGVHEHHIVPKSCGGTNLPTVYLCVPCHGLVHGVEWDPNVIVLSRSGLAAVRAKIEAGIAAGQPHISRAGRPVMKLGNPTTLDVARARSNRSLKANADAFAANVLPIIRQIQESGVTTGRGIADILNARGIPTARGGRWHDSSVRNVLRRTV